jgi:hypothetical protein
MVALRSFWKLKSAQARLGFGAAEPVSWWPRQGWHDGGKKGV